MTPLSSSDLPPSFRAAMRRPPAPLKGPLRREPPEPPREEQQREYEAGEEAKTLHEPMKKWCEYHGILYIYSNPAEPTTVANGTTDFVLMYLGACCVIEFKAKPNPEAALSKAQQAWRDKALAAHVPYLCTNSFKAATEFAIIELELSID